MDITEARRVWLSVILGYGTSVLFRDFICQTTVIINRFLNLPDPAEVQPQARVIVEAPPRQMTVKSTPPATSAKFHNGLPRFSYDVYGAIVHQSDSD